MYYILYIIYIYIYILSVAHTQNKQLHPHHLRVYMIPGSGKEPVCECVCTQLTFIAISGKQPTQRKNFMAQYVQYICRRTMTVLRGIQAICGSVPLLLTTL